MRALDIWPDELKPAINCIIDQLTKLETDRPEYFQAFQRFGHLSAGEARSAIQVNTDDPLLWFFSLGPSVMGRFDPSAPSRIALSSYLAREFAKSPDDQSAQKFLIVSVLHEMCHWGCHRAHVPDPDIAGEEFEKRLFGHELKPWWLSGVLEVSDASTRAQKLKTALGLRQRMNGRSSDPPVAEFAGIDVTKDMSRGIRNNNPGNVRIGSPWQGLSEVSEMTDFQAQETQFCVFLEPEWGLRVIGLLLKKYQADYRLKSIRDIVARWAPTTDNNNVETYSNFLARALSVTPDEEIDLANKDVLIKLIKGICRFENKEMPPYLDTQYEAALSLLEE